MSETHFHDLPNEIIIKILRELNQRELKEAILTCKLWKNIIESACPLSLKLNTRVSYDEAKTNFLLTTIRKFSEIELNGKWIGLGNTLDIIRRHGFNVTTLQLNNICFDSLIEFADLLDCMPNLKTLITLKIRVSCWDGPADEDLPKLRNLETLQMARTSYCILNCLKQAKLTTINVLNSTYEYSYDCEDLVVFLKSQNTLKTLALRGIYHYKSKLFHTQSLSASMPFQLTHLSLLYIDQLDPYGSTNNYSNLLKFMEQQTATLVELELGHKFPGFIYEFVFAKMTNLKTLNVMMSQIPQEKELFQRLVVNPSINNLIFKESPRYNNESVQLYRYFLKCLPNITSLTVINDCCHEIMMVIAETLKELTTLRVSDGTIFDGVQFANLKSLHIEYTVDLDWNEFTKSNSQLTELIIATDGFSLSANDVENITKNTKLHTLAIGDGFKADRSFFDIIRNNCTDLKKLQLFESCVLLNELKNYSDLLRVIRFSTDDYIDYPDRYRTFWNGHLYDDVDEWDRNARVVDMFEYHMMDIELESGHNRFSDRDHMGHWSDDDRDEFEDNVHEFHLDYD